MADGLPFPGELTDVSVKLRREISIYEWGQILDMLAVFSRGLFWHIADVYERGEKEFGEEASQYAERLGLAPQVLLTLLYVGKQFPIDRRRASLPWEFHYTVAKLPQDDQEQLLDYAEHKKPNAAEFRAHVRRYRRGQ